MKLLYAFCATEEVRHRVIQSQTIQRRRPEVMAGWDKLLVTGFGDEIPISPDYNILRGNVRTGTIFSPSKWKNLASRYAAERGYDWMIQANCDLIMLRPPESFPENGLTSVMTYHTKPEEDPEQACSLFDAGHELDFVGTSYLIIHNRVFSNFFHSEELYGYGYEDADYLTNVVDPAGFQRLLGTPYGAKAIHIHDTYHVWGPQMKEDMERNRALFESRYRRMRAGERF